MFAQCNITEANAVGEQLDATLTPTSKWETQITSFLEFPVLRSHKTISFFSLFTQETEAGGSLIFTLSPIWSVKQCVGGMQFGGTCQPPGSHCLTHTCGGYRLRRQQQSGMMKLELKNMRDPFLDHVRQHHWGLEVAGVHGEWGWTSDRLVVAQEQSFRHKM